MLAHVPAGDDGRGDACAGDVGRRAIESLAAETAELSYPELRKRERPFVLPLDPANPEPVERAAYDAAYKGVTDALTLYLWRRPAFYLTRWAAQAGLTPNMVTAIGAIFCVLAFFLFWSGQYWLGHRRRLRLHGARHGRREARALHRHLVQMGQYLRPWHRPHPPAVLVVGVGARARTPTARPLEPVYATMLLWAIIGGYVAQRLIEGIFMRRFGRMHIHVWRPIDSQFRLITARRNPNMVILVAALLFGRPDVGLELVALWTIVVADLPRGAAGAGDRAAARGRPVISWLA